MAENYTWQVEVVRGSPIYPATGPFPKGPASVLTPAAMGHPELRHMTGVQSQRVETAAQLLGRAIFGGYFVYSGLGHFLNRQELVGYARSKGVRAANLAVMGSGLLAMAGGLSFLTGVRPKVGSGLITTFLLGVSAKMHAFWKEEQPQQRMSEIVNFTKNMGLIGGCLMTAAQPEPWPVRMEARPRGELALVPYR